MVKYFMFILCVLVTLVVIAGAVLVVCMVMDFIDERLKVPFRKVCSKLSNGKLFCEHKYIHTYVYENYDHITHKVKCTKCGKEETLTIHKTGKPYDYQKLYHITQVTD